MSIFFNSKLKTFFGILKYDRFINKENINVLRYFFSSDTSIEIILKYFLTKDKVVKNQIVYSKKWESFIKDMNDLNLSADWFSQNIPQWIGTFQKINLEKKKELEILEIGSFEGLSAIFFLKYFSNAIITCVDPWEFEKKSKFDKKIIENNFDNNTKMFKNRLNKFKGSSIAFFAKNEKRYFDLIYIDGSHFFNDVLIDAIKSFELLKKGGIIIFDDFLWALNNSYEYPPKEIVIGAINVFLKSKKGKYEILFVSYQLIIRKLSD